MNKELILILDSIRGWAKSEFFFSCKGDLLTIQGMDKNKHLCMCPCTLCPLIQIRSEKLYPDQIIQTSSQLIK